MNELETKMNYDSSQDNNPKTLCPLITKENRIRYLKNKKNLKNFYAPIYKNCTKKTCQRIKSSLFEWNRSFLFTIVLVSVFVVIIICFFILFKQIFLNNNKNFSK